MTGDPDPEVPLRAKPPRSYSPRYTAEILAKYEKLDKAGKGALLRREGLYSSLIFGVAQAAGPGRRGRVGQVVGSSRLPEMVEYRDGVPVVTNPVQPRENFAERWASDERRAQMFFDWAASAAADFGGFGADGGVDQILTKVAAAFGDRPARVASKEFGMGMFNARSAGKLGMAAGTGTLISGAARTVQNHSFRGDTNR